MTTLEQTTNNIEVPPHGTRCTDVLSDTLRGYAGIEQAEFELEKARLRLKFDPRIISEERALGLVRQAGREAGGRVAHCALRGEATCAKCALQMRQELVAHYQRVAEATPLQAGYRNGAMEIQLAPMLPAGETAEIEQTLAAPIEAQKETESKGISRATLEVVLTITGIPILSERSNAAATISFELLGSHASSIGRGQVAVKHLLSCSSMPAWAPGSSAT